MSAKIRSFLEDMIIILIIGGVIYSIYYFFFYDKTENKQVTLLVKKEKVLKEHIKEPLSTENILKAKEIIKAEETSKNETIEDKTDENKKVEEIKKVTNEEIQIQEEPLEEKEEIKPEEKGTTTQLKTKVYYLKSKPNAKSKSVKKIVRNDSVVIESCDKFGWCKLLDEEAYIPKFVLKEF